VTWGLIALWAATTGYGLFQPAAGSVAGSVPLLALFAFCLIHGAGRYGWRGIGAFCAIALVVANIYENLSIATGFPFGLYHHTEAMGPKLFAVPVVVGPLFFCGSYLAWTLAEILLGKARSVFATPLVAAFVVVGWDICGDPVGATVQGNWVYAQGGGFFGVPLSNFLGWYLTTWTIFQLFALTGQVARARPAGYWLQAPVFWAVMSLPYPLLWLGAPDAMVIDQAGVSWQVAHVFEAVAIMSIFTMLFVAVLAAARVLGPNKAE
jgi:putative membrane protein